MKVYYDASERIKDLCEDKVLEVYVRAEKYFNHSFMNIPRVVLNSRMRGCGGKAFLKKKLIHVNLKMVEKYGQEFIDEIIPHECGHFIEYTMYKRTKHGKRFYELGNKLGYEGFTRFHSFDKILNTTKIKEKSDNKIPISLQKYSHMIDSIEGQRGDYWVYLNTGYHWSGCHFIHESSIQECKSQFKYVEECNCEDCKSQMLEKAQ